MYIKCPCCQERIAVNIHLATTASTKTEQIITICADYFKVSIAGMQSKDRTKQVTDARHVTMFFLKKYTSLQLSGIARIFNRDHTTVLYALRNIDNYFFTKQGIYDDIMNLQRAMAGFDEIAIKEENPVKKAA